MNSLTIDAAFQAQWQRLSDTQKELLFSIAANFNHEGATVHANQGEPAAAGTETYSWEEIKAMARIRERRHHLPSCD